MAETLAFSIVARDLASEKFDRVAAKVDRLDRKLDRLSHKRATPTIDVDVDKPLRKIFGLGQAASAIPDLMESPMKAVTSNIYSLAAAAAAALAALPAIAAVASTGIVLALGGGLAAIGIAAAAQSKKVQKAFGDLKTDVGAKLKAMAAPFEGTLLHIAQVAEKTFGAFAKPLTDAFAKIAPAVSVFADQLGRAFAALAPAIGPVTDAFTAILRQLGPQLPGLFKSLGDSIANVARTVERNAALFTSFIVLLARIAPVAVNATAMIARWFIAVEGGFFKMGVAVGAFGAMFLKGLRVIESAALGFFSDLLHGAVEAFGWLPGVGGKLKRAAAAFETFRAGVAGALDRAIRKTEDWRDAVARMPKKIRLEGEIRDLTGKIEAAKARLKTVPPSKQTAIRAEISQLQAQLARARAALASLHDKTVTVTMRVTQLLATAPARVRQHGGPVAARQAYLVGEKGPELFIPKVSGTVIPNQRIRPPATSPAAATVGGNTYNLNVSVPPTVNRADVGREIVQAIIAYERGNGNRWRPSS